MRIVIIVIAVLFFGACDSSNPCVKTDNITAVPVTIPVERLEEALFSKTDQLGVENFLTENNTFSKVFLNSDQYPHDSILALRISRLLQNKSIDTLFQEAITEFGDISELTGTLEEGIGRLKSLYPDMPTPRLQTIVTGLYNDLYISDSLIIIGLDFFIGNDATYKPLEIPEYVLRRYNKEHLSAIILKFLAGDKVQAGNSSTLLSEMIDFGKTYYLTKRLMPCTPDSILLGYSAMDMKRSLENESIIWATLIQNEALYDTNHILKRRFLGERPSVYEISQDCPGRIGAWVGWRIVESYMEQNNVSLLELVNHTDNYLIFRESGYKPKS
jgi:hypothetical protein